MNSKYLFLWCSIFLNGCISSLPDIPLVEFTSIDQSIKSSAQNNKKQQLSYCLKGVDELKKNSNGYYIEKVIYTSKEPIKFIRDVDNTFDPRSGKFESEIYRLASDRNKQNICYYFSSGLGELIHLQALSTSKGQTKVKYVISATKSAMNQISKQIRSLK